MKKKIYQALSWVLALSIMVSIIPAFDVAAVAAEISEEVSAPATEIGENYDESTFLNQESPQDNETAAGTGQVEEGTPVDEVSTIIKQGNSVLGASTESTSLRFGLTAEEVSAGKVFHGSGELFSAELDAFVIASNSLGITAEQKEDILFLICAGFTSGQAYAAIVSKDILDISLNELAKVKIIEINELKSSDEYEDEVVEDFDERINVAANKMGVPYCVVEEYLTKHDETCDELLLRFKIAYMEAYHSEKNIDSIQTTATTATEESFYTPDKILDKPYSYDELGDISINLNRGNFTYSEVDLSIPGVNGLDLNIVRRYQSNWSEMKYPTAYMDEDYSDSECIAAGYKVYLFEEDSEGNEILSEITDMSDYIVDDLDPDVANLEFENPYYLRKFTAENYEKAVEFKDELYAIEQLAYLADDPDEEVWLYFKPFVFALPDFDQAFENMTFEYNYYPEEYGLGYGWSLAFSGIERYRVGIGERSQKRLITCDGQKYTINFDGDEFSNLVNYDREDMILYDDGGGYTGARYRLVYENGNIEYFNSDGRIIAIVDRYGNTISFSYTLSLDGNVSKIEITDTNGNFIEFAEEAFEYDSENLPTINGKSNGEYNSIRTLKLNNQLIQTYYIRKPEGDESARYELIAAENSLGDYIFYRQRRLSYSFNCFLPTHNGTHDGSRVFSYLAEVTYPTGLEKAFDNLGGGNKERLGASGHTEFPAVETYSEYYKNTDGNDVYNSWKEYSYGDYSALNLSKADIAVEETNTYNTTVLEGHVKTASNGKKYTWFPAKDVYVFTHETHNNIEIAHYEQEFCQYEDISYGTNSFIVDGASADIDQTYKLTQKTEYEYDDWAFPQKATTFFYNRGSSTASMTETYLYEYDAKGNLLEETRPNGLVISNTYWSNYSLPKSTTYNQDDDTEIVSTNTLTSDKKSIAQNTVTSNGTTVGKTAYTYDSYGRVLTEKKYSSASVYAETQYTYTTGYAQPTAVISKDIRNADGTLVTGTSGYSSGQLATRYQYNDKGEITAETDPNGNTTGIQYDAAGRITKVTNPDGTYASYTYDVANNTVLYTDERGTVLRYEYDPFGSLTGIYDVAGSQYLSQTEYGSYGWPIKEIQHSNGSDKITCYRYDAAGRPIDVRTEDEDGTVTSRTTYEYTYANSLFKTKQTVVGDSYAPDVVTTTYKDNMDQTVKTGKSLNGTEYFDTYTYDNVGNVLTEQTAYSASLDDDYTYQYTYDTNGNVLTRKDALGNTARYYYNWLGNCSRATDPMGNITYYTYDKLGRKIREEQPYSEQDISDEEIITVYVDAKLYYDNNGNLITEKHANNDEWADTTWAQTDYAYDSRNRLVKVTAYDNGSVENVTQYYYDAGGNILRMYTGLSSPLTITGLDSVSGSDTNYAVTKYTYDRFGNQLTMTDPLNKTEAYTYDLNGNPLTKVDRNNVTTRYTYDSLGRLSEVNAGGAVPARYTYTFSGQKISETDGNEKTTVFRYDGLGRMISQEAVIAGSKSVRAGGGEDGEYIDDKAYKQTYTYDIGDHRTGYVVTIGSTQQINNTYAYDAMGRMTSVTDKDNNTTRYTYNANGARSSITYPNGVVGTYTYNQVNLLEQIAYSGTNSGTQPRYTYTYYLDGNLASETKENGESTTYVYDDLGRLTSETLRNGTSLVQKYTYTYDDFGNRATLTATGADAYTTTYTYNLANRLTSETKTQSGTTSTTTYTYDGNGNQLTKNTGNTATTVTNQYSTSNQLQRTTVNGNTIQYRYNPSGIRTGKIVNGSIRGYVLDGEDVTLETVDGGVVGKYIYGVNLISRDGSNYYLHNGHGDVTYLTDDDGAITKTYEYDAFGNEENPVSTDINPFRYAGEYYDAETETYYLRARYYDPVIGRFTQEDPHWNVGNMIYGDDPLKLNNYNYAPSLAAIIQSGNLYVYAMNNPTRYTDPDGKSVIGTLLLAGIYDGLTTGGLYMLSGKGFIEGFTNGFASGFATTGISLFGAAIGPGGAYVGAVIGSAFGSALGSLAEDVLWHRNEKSKEDMAISAAKSAATGLIAGLPATHIEYAIDFSKEVGFVADELMEYNAYLGEALHLFFTALEEMLKIEATVS